MKLSWRTEWPLWLLLAAMFLAAAISWPGAPDRIPVHWGVDGSVNGYGGKFEGLLLLPLVGLLTYFVFLAAPRLDPLRANYERFAGAFTLLRFTVLLFLAILQLIMLLAMRGIQAPMHVLAPVMVGALLIVVGFVLRKLRPNWFMGLRTPWTLMSRRSWIKTHEAAQWIFSAAGLGFMASGFLRSEKVLIGTIVFMAIGILSLVVYSYFLWRDDPERVPPPSSLHAD